MMIFITGEEILSRLDVYDIVNALWTNDDGDIERINTAILEVAREAA